MERMEKDPDMNKHMDTDDRQRILNDVVLGRPSEVHSQEEWDYRKACEKEVAEMRYAGKQVHCPAETPGD
jgi:hypothetical protein